MAKVLTMNDRQKRIREHIAKSSGGKVEFQRIPQNSVQNKTKLSVSSSKKSRKEHLTRSLGNYDLTTGSKQDRKNSIMEHIRISKG